MRAIFSIVFILILIVVMALFCSGWYVVIDGPQVLFKSAQVSQFDNLNLMPIYSGNVELMKCYIDKEDYYSLVMIGGGGLGYMFDNRQNYVHYWIFDVNNISLSGIFNRFECFIFVLQFGK